MTVWDACIVGGGPAGASAAIALARLGASVVMVERSKRGVRRSGEMLPPEAKRPLEKLGVWERFLNAGHQAVPGILVAWEDEAVSVSDFLWNAYGNGWHVDRVRFDGMLHDEAARAGAVLRFGIAVDAASRADDGWCVSARSDRATVTIRARAVVDARGRSFRRERRVVVDRMIAISALFDGQSRFGGMHSLIESCKNGWFYSAPLSDDRIVVAYMTDPDQGSSTHGPGEVFEGALTDSSYTARRVSRLRRNTLRVEAAQTSMAVTQPQSPILAGDARYSVDPLAARGLYRALAGAPAIANATIAHLNGRDDLLAEENAKAAIAFQRVLRQRREHYARVTRWESAFWRRRRTDQRV